MALISNSSQSYVLTPTTLVSGSAGSAGSSGSSGSTGVMSSAGSCPTGTANVATRSTCTYTANAPQTIMVSTVTTNAAGSAGSAGSGSYLTMLTSGSASSFGSTNIGVTRTDNAKTPVQSESASSIGKTTTTPAGTLKRDPSGQYWIRENLGITTYALEISGPWYTNINEFISLYDIEVTTTTPAPSASGDVPPGSHKNSEIENKFDETTIASIASKWSKQIANLLSKALQGSGIKFNNINITPEWISRILGGGCVIVHGVQAGMASNKKDLADALKNLVYDAISFIPEVGWGVSMGLNMADMVNDNREAILLKVDRALKDMNAPDWVIKGAYRVINRFLGGRMDTDTLNTIRESLSFLHIDSKYIDTIISALDIVSTIGNPLSGGRLSCEADAAIQGVCDTVAAGIIDELNSVQDWFSDIFD